MKLPKLPEEESTWQFLISLTMLVCSIVLILIAETRHRQTLQMLREVKAIEQTIKQTIKKEVCR
jgi:hypothetical protein